MSSGRALVAFALVSGVVVLAWWLWPSGLVLPPPAIPVPLERTPAEALPPVPETTLPAAPAEPTEVSPAEPHPSPSPRLTRKRSPRLSPAEISGCTWTSR